jgi:DNA-binding NtrC family response regulator
MPDIEVELQELERRLGIEKKMALRPKVLVVDDDRDIRASISDVLMDRYDIRLCENAEEAFRKCTSDTRVALLDIKIQGKGGLVIYKELKKQFPKLPILFFTAHAGYHEAYLESKKLEPFEIIQKGCGIQELVDVIERALK